MNHTTLIAAGACLVLGGAIGAGITSVVGLAAAADSSASLVAVTPERGRHIIRTSGCNDCHPAGYMERGEGVPESEWMTGMPVGFRGPWGTTYGSNLRLLASQMDLQAWIANARRTNGRPPMPWPAVHAMTDSDLAAVHAYLNRLNATTPPGEPAPAYVPPDAEPVTPYIDMIPKMPAGAGGA